MTELYLVGTVHIDLKGPERLDKLLDHLEPDHVSVEYDSQRAQYADAFQLAIQNPKIFEEVARNFEKSFRGSNQETVRRFLESTDFEYFCAKKYCVDNQAKLWLSDNLDVENFLDELEDSSSQKNKEMVKIMSITSRELQRKSESFYSGELPEVPEEELKKLKLRDKYFAKVLRDLYEKSDGRIVHMGGMGHTHGNYHNLSDRLRFLNPKRIKLNEADNLFEILKK